LKNSKFINGKWGMLHLTGIKIIFPKAATEARSSDI